jgi:hypothetical protein
MSSLEPNKNQRPSSRTSRWVERSLNELDATTTVELAHLDAIVELQQDQIRAMNNLGTSALIATSQLSQTENTLAQLVPHASGRLAAIADLVTVQNVEILVDSARRIRRAGQ